MSGLGSCEQLNILKYTCINAFIKSNTTNKYLCSILIKIDNDYQQRHESPDNINKLKLCPDQACENKMLQKNVVYYLIPRYLRILKLSSPGVVLL